jgi:hypothetical protein
LEEKVMKNNLILCLAFACTVLASTTYAQDGKNQKVSGTLSSVQGEHLMVDTGGGKSVMVMLDPKTTITKDKKKVEAKSLKPGDQIAAEGPGDSTMIMATTVEVGAAKPTKK